MEPILNFAEFIAALLGVIAFACLIVAVMRSYKIPECFSCGAMKMRPSRIEGFWDTFLIAFQVEPYRCSGCRERFHAVRLFRKPTKPIAAPAVRQQRVVTVAFRFRHGLPNRIAIRVTHPQQETGSASAAILQTEIS